MRTLMPDLPTAYHIPGHAMPWWNMLEAANLMGIEFCAGCDALLGHQPQSFESGGQIWSTAPMRGHEPWCRNQEPSVLDPVIAQHEAWARWARSKRIEPAINARKLEMTWGEMVFGSE